MALVLADRVEQVTRTTGLGDLQLAETIRGRQSFQDVTNNGDTVIYVLEDAEGMEWEIGEGTVFHGTTTVLQRTTIRQSSNADAKISLSAGTHRVFLVADAAYLTGLTTSAELAAAIAAHEAASDPHPQYTTTAEAAAAAPVQSVNGETGTVLLDAADVGATPSSHVGTGGAQHANATTTVAGFMSGADKTKLDGIEVNAKDDQSAAEVPYSNATSGLTATDVQAALDEIDGQVDTNTSDISTNADAISQNTSDINQRTIYVGSVAESFAGLSGVDGAQYQAIAWHPGGAAQLSPRGGKAFVYRSGVSKSSHNGINVISSTVPSVSAQTGATLADRVINFLQAAGETDGAGTGCFVRDAEDFYTPYDAGALALEPKVNAVSVAAAIKQAEADNVAFGCPYEVLDVDPTAPIEISAPIEFYGRGPATGLRNISTAGIDLFALSPSAYIFGLNLHDISFTCEASAGHIFNITVGLVYSAIRNTYLVQNNPGKSIWHHREASAAGAGIYDTLFEGGYWKHANNGTVAPVDLRYGGTLFNLNTFRNIRVDAVDGGFHFFDIRNTGAGGNWLEHNKFERIDFERTNGGCVRASSANQWEFNQCAVWDLTAATLRDLFEFADDGNNESVQCSFKQFIRNGGPLGAGLHDIKTTAGQDFQYEMVAGAGASISIDVNSKRHLQKNCAATFVNLSAIKNYSVFDTGSTSGANVPLIILGNGDITITSGAGTPEGAVTAPAGSIYTNTNGGAGTTLYVKESGAGNTGWVAK